MKNLPAIFLASTLLATGGAQSKARAGDEETKVKTEIKDPIAEVGKVIKEVGKVIKEEAAKATAEADEARAAVAKARLLVQEREKINAENARISKLMEPLFGKKGEELLETAEKIAVECAKTKTPEDDKTLRDGMLARLEKSGRYKITPEGVANALRHLPEVKKEVAEEKTAEKPADSSKSEAKTQPTSNPPAEGSSGGVKVSEVPKAKDGVLPGAKGAGSITGPQKELLASNNR